MAEQRISGWCALCRSRCGCVSVVRDGEFVAVERDPTHPTGRALCAKGQAGPEQVYAGDRLLYPMKRTAPKGAADPGWERISWDEALDLSASALRRLAAESGPESVAFAITTPSGTAMSDSIQWVERLMRAFGSPNNCYGTEICNWHKDVATTYTFGTGIGNLDFEHTGLMLLWGHNPGGSWLAQGQKVAEAKARGARLVVIDPRRVGPAAKADQWLRVRPGTDGALALSLAGVMIDAGWYDEEFLRDWSNGPFLVHSAEGRLLTGADLAVGGSARDFVVWDEEIGAPAAVDPTVPLDPRRSGRWALRGAFEIQTPCGPTACEPAFEAYRALCARLDPDTAEAVTGVPAAQIRETAELLWSARPVSYYPWSGVGQHTNATQTARAIALLYALTGSQGAPGGNVDFAKVPVADLSGLEFVTPQTRSKTLGMAERPLGPPKDGWVGSDHLYAAVLEGKPYPVKGLVGFGANLLIGHAGVERGIEALEALDFYVHADIFLNPTAAYADVILPVCTSWEREVVRAGFEIDQGANGRVQLREPVVAPRGESREDADIAFALAERLGLGNLFWNGDRDAAWREMLEPAGISLDALRATPGGIDIALYTEYRPFERTGGFATPSRRVEIWSETFRVNGHAPLPEFEEPAVGPRSRPDLLARFPLVLTSAKPHQFCHGQHRNLPRLRKLLKDPRVEMHPDAAAARAIEDGDWVAISTPSGSVRARARLRATLARDVVCAQHGWWQACEPLGLPGYPVAGAGSANFNLLIDDAHADPVSGSTPNRSYLCDITRIEPARPN